MHELLLSATDLKVASLTGAPIINYPNEIGVLYNILRGHIKTWEFLITVKSSEKINKETIMTMFERANFRTYDFVMFYVDFGAFWLQKHAQNLMLSLFGARLFRISHFMRSFASWAPK